MKNYCWIAFVLLTGILGCKEQKSQTNSQATIISADLDKMDEISIHDIFDKVEIIPLETTDESLIIGCQKVICYNDKYYVLEVDRIFAFDDKGSFLWKIDGKGQGPEQYLHIADLDINRGNNNLVFVSAMNKALYEYDLDGRFLNKQKLPDVFLHCSELRFINSDTIAFWTHDYQNRLKLYSAGSNQIFKECIPEREHDFVTRVAFSSCNHNYFTKTAQNDIYEIMPDGEISVACAWDFGDLNIDVEKLEKTKFNSREEFELFFNKLFSSENINYAFISLGSNSDYLHTQVIRKNKIINVLYNKNDQKASVFEKTKEGVHIYPIYWTDDFVIGYIRDFSLLAKLFENDFEKVIPDAILDTESLEKKKRRNEFDNPFLIKYYFKK